MEQDVNRIVQYLSSSGKEMEALFEQAREVRRKVFADRIFLYGFVYFSTYCRNNCSFCYFRKSNEIERYRKPKEEIVEIARQLADSGVHVIDLTMGEDSAYHEEDFETVLAVVKEIKENLRMPVMISPGVVPPEVIDRLGALHTEWYALYQETHNRTLFAERRLDQSYDVRMGAKIRAKEQGMLIEEGIMTGIGESLEDIAHSILTMGEIGASQIRVMSFVPQEGSPMENEAQPDPNLELKIIAVMRILYPEAMIPASLDVDGIQGLESRVNAGANVVTSIIPPRTGLMGVAQSKRDVEEGGRTVAEATSILSNMGLTVGSLAEYQAYVEKLRNQ